jgi:hypothetical protein
LRTDEVVFTKFKIKKIQIMNPTMVLSGLALLSGFGIRYWINRRKF